MKALLKRLLSDSVIYGLSGILSSFISIFLIPLYTKVFEPSDYGIISLLLTSSAFLNILLIFSLDSSATVWFWDKTEKNERVTTFTSWLVFLGVTGLILGLILIGFSSFFSELLFKTNKYFTLFILLGINLIFAGFQKAANIWCRMLQKPFLAMGYSIFLLLATVACNVFLILKLKVGIVGVFYSQALAALLGFIGLVVLFRNWIDLKSFSWMRLKEMLKFASPLVPATVMYWLMSSASVFFIKYYIKDNAEIGLFQIGSSVAGMLSLLTWGFFQAWSTFALSIAKQENAKRIYSFIMELFCVLGFFIAFSLFLTAEDILKIFTNEKYLGARYVIGILAVNVVLQGIPNILAVANYISKNNNSYAIAIVIGAAFSVLGFIILIPIFGKEGAALAMVLGNLVVPIYLGVKAQKLYYVPYNFARIIGFVLLEAFIFVVAKYYTMGIAFHIVCVCLIGILILYLYYIIARKSGMISRNPFGKRNLKV